jgi:hypothetical protein
MDPLLPVIRLLEVSSDPANPAPGVLRDLFERMRRIAVIGISRDPLKAARRVPSYLAARGYDVIPINPYADRILGKEAYATLTEVDPPIDLVLIFRPTGEAGAFVAEAAARPDRPAIWLQEGIHADIEVTAARNSGLIAVQDLCAYKVHRALYPQAPSSASASTSA